MQIVQSNSKGNIQNKLFSLSTDTCEIVRTRSGHQVIKLCAIEYSVTFSQNLSSRPTSISVINLAFICTFACDLMFEALMANCLPKTSERNTKDLLLKLPSLIYLLQVFRKAKEDCFLQGSNWGPQIAQNSRVLGEGVL